MRRSIGAGRTTRGVIADGYRHDERSENSWIRRLPLTDYETIECPVLVAHGTYDAAVPIAHAEFVAERLERAEFHRIEADHSLLTGPDGDQFTRTVRTFIDQTMPSTAQTPQAEFGHHPTTAIEVGRPARHILEYVAEHDIELIVMGTRGTPNGGAWPAVYTRLGW